MIKAAIQSFFTCTTVVLLLANISLPSVSAYSSELYDKDIIFYDPPGACGGGAAPAVSGDDSLDGKKVYMVGDSITEVSTTELKKDFRDAGANPTVHGVGSSAIVPENTPDGVLSGVEVVEQDKNKVRDADIVVIAHGTNEVPGVLAGHMKQLMRKMRGYNNNASYYWVNTFTSQGGGNPAYTAEGARKKNGTIDRLSSELDYTVVDVKSANISTYDGIHPDNSAKGIKKYAKSVVDGMASEAAVADDCSCSIGFGSGSNPEIVFQYLTGQGLSPEQAAGVYGNLVHESGGEDLPTGAVEGGGVSSTPTPGVGYGIAQWTTSGRQQGLVNFARSISKPVDSIEAQIGYLWKELVDNPGQRGGSPDGYGLGLLRNANTVADATEIFGYHFERPLASAFAASLPDRISDAERIFNELGGGVSGGGLTPSCGGAGGGAIFDGSVQDAAKSLLENSDIQIFDDRDLIQAVADGRDSPLSGELIILMASLAQNHSFGISSLYRGPCGGSNHCTGHAADINPSIDGETISYSGHSRKIQKFIDDAASILKNSCENGVPNEQYVNATKSNGSKCEVFVDTGTGPHVHLAVNP